MFDVVTTKNAKEKFVCLFNQSANYDFVGIAFTTCCVFIEMLFIVSWHSSFDFLSTKVWRTDIFICDIFLNL